MLFSDNGETNKCLLYFDVKYKLSTDTNQIQIYTTISVQSHDAIFNGSSCGLPRYVYAENFSRKKT
jgi:hypothetical protein